MVSSDSQIVDYDISDRGYFKQLKANYNGRILYSESLRLKSNGKPFVAAYRAIIGRQGEFLGAVVAPIDLEFFSQLFSQINVGKEGMVSVRRSDDSRLVVRWPVVEPEINGFAPKIPPYLQVLDGRHEGVVRYIGKTDGVDRIFAYHTVEHAPFFVLVGRSIHEGFASWRQTAAIASLLTFMVLIFMGYVTYRSQRNDLAMRLSEQRLKMAMSIARQGWFDLDISKGEVSVGDEYPRLLGYEPAEFQTSLQNWLASIHPDDRQAVEAAFQKACASGKAAEMVYRRRSKSGEWVWIESIGKVINFDAHGRPVRMVGIHMDVTNRKAAEAQIKASEKRFQDIVEATSDWIWEVDAQGRYTFVSKGIEQVLGYSPEEVIGRTPFDLMLPEDAARVSFLFSDIAARKVSFRDLANVNIHKDGSLRYLLTTGVPILDDHGNLIGYRGLDRDNTQRRSAEEQMRVLSEAISQSPNGVIVTDSEVRIVYVNDAFCRISGFAAEEVLGQSAHMLGTDATPSEVIVSLNRALSDGTAWEGEFHNRRHDGSIGIDYCHIAPVRNQDGLITHYVSVQEDVTEKRRVEQELALYRQHLEELVAIRTEALSVSNQKLMETEFAMDRAGISIHWVDADTGSFLYVNRYAADMLGYSVEEMLHMSVLDIDPNFRTDSFRKATDWMRNESTSRFETTQRTKDGRLIPVELLSYFVAARENQPPRFITFSTDISQRKATESALQSAKEAAESANVAKSEFLANMSHEIRTPLNGVLGMAQIGYRESAGRDKTQATFGRILDSGRLLLTLINDILDFSKIEAGKLVLESVPIDPARLVDEAASTLKVNAAAKDLVLVVEKSADLPAACLGDPVRLSQILLNLLSNAIKFTEEGEVRLSAAREGYELVFRVSDTGMGISQKDRQRLFGAFEQLDSSTTRKFGGTGLGLAISRRLADLMDGKLTVTSVVGQGSTFELRMPFFEAAAPIGKPLVAEVGGWLRLAGVRILAAEDNEVNRLVLQDMLEGEGAQVDLVTNGRLALEAVERASPPYRVVLMDVQMPELDGLAATRCLREIAPDLPVIGQTAHAMQEEHERCRAAGMVATITKPLDLEQLVGTILAQVGPQLDVPGVAMPLSARQAEMAIDWEALGKRYKNRQTLIDKLLVVGIESNEGVSGLLRELADAGNFEEIEHQAHSLKSFSGNLCAPGVTRLAMQTMQACKVRDPACPALARELADALDQLIRSLRERGGHAE